MQTQAKREYNKTLSEFLQKEDDNELAQKLELLRLFLESYDFSQLRSEYEKHLQEGKEVRFKLYLADNKPEYEITII